SVDLDFNQIGTREEVLKDAKDVRQALVQIANKQDKSYKIDFKPRYEQTTVHLKYATISGQPLQPIKIEVSHIERFSILKTENKELMIYDLGAPSSIGTYRIEELLATKLRALYDRMKGRDLYDLALSFKLVKDKTALRKMFLYYFYRDRKVFSPRKFFEKVSGSSYEDDVSGFVRSRDKFDLDGAKKEIVQNYSFIGDLDDTDKQFLVLARSLLGDNVKKKVRGEIQNIKYPFRKFFDGTQDVNQDIFQIRTDEIRLYEESSDAYTI
ncbi:MAG: nucleotidyl transferase AbiEii/AbiGii toxin family protein, partial [Nitrosopumilaceae archaeon]